MKRNTLVLLVILTLGSLLRILVIQNRDLFVDEVYYWRVSQMNSWKNLLFITHWIKDHGILYYVWLKALSLFVTDIPTLRYSNIILYIVSSVFFYRFFKKKYGFSALLGIALFSFHRYFVYLSSTLSPYNLVWCLAGISIGGFYFLRESKNKSFWSTLFFVVIVTVGAFYTDYSFFFTLPFYISFFIAVMRDAEISHEKKRYILLLYGIIFVFILPGLIQLVSNLNLIQELFANRYFEHSLSRFIYITGGMLFLRVVPLLGVVLMVLPLPLVLFVKGMKDRFVVYSYIGGLCMIFISQRFFFPLFAERYMWGLYFFFIIFIMGLLKRRVAGGMLVGAIFIIGGIVNYSIPITNTFRVPGDISYEVKYSSLLLNKKNEAARRVIVLDSTSTSDVFTHYYFGSRYPRLDKHFDVVQTLKEKITIISPRADDNGRDLKKLLVVNQKPCILYYVTKKNENVLKNKTVRQLGCETIYSLNNVYGYVDSFEIIYPKKQ